MLTIALTVLGCASLYALLPCLIGPCRPGWDEDDWQARMERLREEIRRERER